MKRRAVKFTPSAQADTRESFQSLDARSPAAAGQWLREFWEAIDRLETFAGHAVASESGWLGCELRQMVFKCHRVLDEVNSDDAIVQVLYVSHQAQRFIGQSDH